jgi:hypothetical protein
MANDPIIGVEPAQDLRLEGIAVPDRDFTVPRPSALYDENAPVLENSLTTPSTTRSRT